MSSSSGPAEIVITKKIDKIIEGYLDDIRIHVIAQRESLRDRLFLTYTGNKFTKISEMMKQVPNMYGYTLPTATINRKVTATATREQLTQQQALAVHGHMSHTPETSMRSYQFPSMEDFVDIQHTIQQLQARKYFAEEDSKILKAWPLIRDDPCFKSMQSYNEEV